MFFVLVAGQMAATVTKALPPPVVIVPVEKRDKHGVGTPSPPEPAPTPQAVPYPASPPIRFPRPMAEPAYLPFANGPGNVPYQPVVVSIDLMANSEPLWRGDLRVGGSQPATFSQERLEALPVPANCVQNYGGGATQRTGITVSLTSGYSQAATGRMQVNVTLTRLTSPSSCSADQGSSRTVSFAENVTVERGKATEVRGDGGLVVRLQIK